jgi:6,7-dimethyl-8-ribityllumazine synthase
MSSELPNRPRVMTQRRSVAVVASQYHPQYVGSLIDFFRKEMAVIAPGVAVKVHEAPGAFELPVVAQELAEIGGVDAIVAMGVVIEGATYHAQLIGEAVTHALMDCSLRYRIPVINEVLVLRDEEQADARCVQPEMNRGTEAARAVVRVIQTMADIRPR